MWSTSSRKDPPRTLAQQRPRREPPAPGDLDAPGHEAVQRIGPQAVSLAHFSLGPGDGSPGLDVLPAVGPFVAVEAAGALPVVGVRPPGIHLRGYARAVFGISPCLSPTGPLPGLVRSRSGQERSAVLSQERISRAQCPCPNANSH